MKKKDVRKIKKRLLREELRRQGKTRRRTILVCCALLLLLLAAGGGIWYRLHLNDILEIRFEKARELRTAGRYGEALTLLQTLYRQHPHFKQTAQVLFLTAEILHNRMDDHQQALLHYLLLERDHPDFSRLPLVLRRIADIYKYQLMDQVQAITAYQKLLDGPAEQPAWIQYEVADSYFRLNNFEQARIEFNSLLKSYPDSELAPEVQFRIAVTYALERQFPEAEAAYRLVLEHWPDSAYAPEARFGLAAIFEEQEELRKALDILEEMQNYPHPEVLQQKIEKVRARIDKKKKAI